MPRGSKPGERRGGRQRGTPNKTTALKNAVLCAAAAKPNASPLDFMLGLMRDPAIPTDLQLEMAVPAARYMHAKPGAFRRGGLHPLDVRAHYGKSASITPRDMETELSAPAPAVNAKNSNLTPLNFLLNVMNDPEATPQQRIRAARVAARYRHEPAEPEVRRNLIEDTFGFKIDPAVASVVRDLSLQVRWLSPPFAYTLSRSDAQNKASLSARVRHLTELIECPASYTVPHAKLDQARLLEFVERRRTQQPMTRDENAEEAYLTMRLEAFLGARRYELGVGSHIGRPAL